MKFTFFPGSIVEFRGDLLVAPVFEEGLRDGDTFQALDRPLGGLLAKVVEEEHFKGKKGRIVCTLTGHGLKDPDRAIKSVKSFKVIKPDQKAILKEIGF